MLYIALQTYNINTQYIAYENKYKKNLKLGIDKTVYFCYTSIVNKKTGGITMKKELKEDVETFLSAVALVAFIPAIGVIVTILETIF